jgi:hypothetical protein
MEIFLYSIVLLIGAFFIFIGIRFFFSPEKIINAIQKYKYKTTATPRKQEIIMARIMGILFLLVGLYFAFASIVAIISFL